MPELFSVYWYDPDGNQYRERHLQPLVDCKEAFDRLTTGPAATMGIVARIKITDSLDRLAADLENTSAGWVRHL